jgi:hypothetical protein
MESMPREIIQLVGQRFGKLLVIKFSHVNRHKQSLWVCKCDCGNTKCILSNNLRSGRSNSCGCVTKDNALVSTYKHGCSNGKNKLYNCWKAITQRTTNKSNKGYKNYGGRGIKICKRWTGKNGFINFSEDMGSKPSPRHSIERVNNNGDYCPENCRWATRKEQNSNTRRSKNITFEGKTQTIREWCIELGLTKGSVQYRLKVGKPIEEVLKVSTFVEKLDR